MYLRIKMADTESLYAVAKELTEYIERSDNTGYLSTRVVRSLVKEIDEELDNLTKAYDEEVNYENSD